MTSMFINFQVLDHYEGKQWFDATLFPQESQLLYCTKSGCLSYEFDLSCRRHPPMLAYSSHDEWNEHSARKNRAKTFHYEWNEKRRIRIQKFSNKMRRNMQDLRSSRVPLTYGYAEVRAAYKQTGERLRVFANTPNWRQRTYFIAWFNGLQETLARSGWSEVWA